MNRREFLRLAGLSAVSGVSILSGCAPSVEPTTTPSTLPGNAARLSLRIAPVKLELSPNQIIQTVGYNGSAPGPLLRVKEGQQVTVNVRNDTDVPELVHWHGFYVPSEVERRHGRGNTDGCSRRHAAIFFHGAAERKPVVSHPRLCRQRSAPQSLLWTIWFLLY